MKKLIGAVVVGIAGFLALIIIVVAGAASPSQQAGLAAGSVCATSGPVAGLDAAQAANGRVVAATATARGGNQAALIALMTAMDESSLLVKGNPNDPATMGFPSQGVSTDLTSAGLFAQQTWWGTAAQRMDPVASTNLFLDRLLSLSGWSTMLPWVAAQAVQASGTASGANYLAQLPIAQSILTVITGTPAAMSCGGSGAGVLGMPVTPGTPVTQEFHPRGGPLPYHPGIDFGVPCGSPIYAALAGTISQEQTVAQSGGYGNRIVVDHGSVRGVALSTTYNHLTSFVAGPGPVTAGELIGISGTTGNSTGCHLHFEVRINADPINPRLWLTIH